MPREVDNRMVRNGEIDDDSVSYGPAATDAARAPGPAPAEVFADRGSGYARPSCGVSYSDVDVVGS